MRKIIVGILVSLLPGIVYGACDPTLSPTHTNNLGLEVPQINSCGWGYATNANWGIVDSSVILNGFTGATGKGLIDDTTSFARPTGSTGTFYVPPGTYLIGSDINIAPTVVFAPGAMLQILSSATVTFANTPVASPDSQIFSTTGTVKISNARADVYAEWWGAKTAATIGGPFIGDASQAFQKADQALINGGHIQALVGVYSMGAGVTFNNASLSGQGFYTNNNGTVFLPTNSLAAQTTALFTINAATRKYDNFMIAGNIDPASFTGIYSGPSFGGNILEKIYFKLVGNGIWLTSDNGSVFHQIYVVSASSNCILLGGVAATAVGDTHWDQIVLQPKAGIGQGIVEDGNVSAQYIHRVTEVGGVNGIWIRGTGGTFGGSMLIPSNLNVWDSIINANTNAGIKFDRNLDALIQMNTINGNGNNIQVTGVSSAAVDGIELDDNFMDGSTWANVEFSTGINLNINGGSYFNASTSSPSIHVGPSASGVFSVQNIMCGVPGEWGNTPNSGKYCVLLDTGSLTDTPNLGGTAVQGQLVLQNINAINMSQSPFENYSHAFDTATYISNIVTGLQPNFNYGNSLSASVFRSSVTMQGNLLVGTTAVLGQTLEKARIKANTNQNVILAGAQGLSSGVTILGETDSNTLAPLQLRGSQLYWSSSDGNVGIGSINPSGLLEVASGTVKVDGNGSSLNVQYGASVGSATVRNIASGTQCIHADSSGNLTGTGSDCLASSGLASLSASQSFTGVNTFSSSVTVNNTVGATKFTDATGRSIYGNFVASNTVTAGSSATVNVSGYTQYVIQYEGTNATGSAASLFLRFNFDNSTNYSYSTSGFLNTASTGTACGNVAAKQVILTGVNNWSSTLKATGTLFLHQYGSQNFLYGDGVYQESSGNNIANLNLAAYGNISTLTSIQIFAGQMQSCTVATDPTTGTTAILSVYGIF